MTPADLQILTLASNMILDTARFIEESGTLDGGAWPDDDESQTDREYVDELRKVSGELLRIQNEQAGSST
ncbi:MAG: hypothetical protein Q8N51_00630 [Gammaproteobacteria bacterium]|nr:hypothetical protein [Gammaproteobacteria bacterium]